MPRVVSVAWLVASILVTTSCVTEQGYLPRRDGIVYLVESQGRLAAHKDGETVLIEEGMSKLVECSTAAIGRAEAATGLFREGRYREGSKMVVAALSAHNASTGCVPGLAVATASTSTGAIDWIYDGKLRARRGTLVMSEVLDLIGAVSCVPEAQAFAYKAMGAEYAAKLFFWGSAIAGVASAVGLARATAAENSARDEPSAKVAGYGTFAIGGGVSVATAIIGAWYGQEARARRYDAVNAYQDAYELHPGCLTR